MSLYDEASLIAYPSGYKESKIYTQKPVPSYGAELVTNGNFATDSNWTKGTGWTISGGTANGTGSVISSIIQQPTYIVGRTYKLTFTISNRTVGTIRPFIGVTSGLFYTSNGTFSENIVYSSGTDVNIQKRDSFNGSIDNVSVKEVLVAPADLTFTRASSATRVNAEGLIETAAILGSEQVTGFTNGTTYPFDTFITSDNNITSAIVSSDFAGAASNAISVTSGEIYKVTFDYTKNSGDDLRVLFSVNANGAAAAISNTELISASGTYTKYFTITSTTTGYLQMGTASGSDSLNISITNVSVKEATISNIPRIDYSNGCGSLLLEPQRTNLVINSNSGFTAVNMNLVYNNATSPDGTQNAYKSTTTSTSNAHVRTLNIAFANTSTFSVFLKYGNNQWYQILNASANTLYVNVDIQNGVFGTSGSGTSNLAIKDYGNGWYRVSGTFTYAGSATTLRVYTGSLSNHGYAGTNATIGSYNYGFGFQVEEGSYPTSYIPTSSTTVTRLADSSSTTGLSSVIGQTEGTYVIEFKLYSNSGNQTILDISDDSSSDRLGLILSSSVLTAFRLSPTDTTTLISTSTADADTTYKCAFAYSSGRHSFYVNGVQIGSDANTITALNLFKINVGSRYNGGENIGGNVQNLMVFPSALTDEQLTDLTGAVHQTFNSLATFYGYTIL